MHRRRFLQAALANAVLLSDPAFPANRAKRSVRFGANYTPSKNWWFIWYDWDAGSIARDLHSITSIGLDHIRIQLLWPAFQPGIATVSKLALMNLVQLLDIADKAHLDVSVTVLTGWLSGLFFMPAWVAPLVADKNPASGNIFTDRNVIAAEKLLFSALANAIGSHPRFLGFDLGNELTVVQTLGHNPVPLDTADQWASEMLDHCREIAPGKIHVNGVDHLPWFNDLGFSRKNAASAGSLTTVHSYPEFDGLLSYYPATHPAATHLAEFEIELAFAYHNDPSRRVWLQECGTVSIPEANRPQFLSDSLAKVLSTGKLWGITWWCSHDIPSTIRGFDEPEYHLGLFDSNNHPKPLAGALQSFVSNAANNAAVPVERPVALAIPDSGLSTNPDTPDWTYARKFFELLDRGQRPSIVLQSRVHDTAYLERRGIRKVIPIEN